MLGGGQYEEVCSRAHRVCVAIAVVVAGQVVSPPPTSQAESTAVVRPAALSTAFGYWIAQGSGSTRGFGIALSYGSPTRVARPIVGMAATPRGRGYWLVASDGGIFSYGDARFFGSTGAIRLSRPIVGMAATPSGRGYWLVASDGGIFSYGDARFFGSTGAIRLNRPIVGMAATPTGRGYWLVASDGGIFSYGDARFFGSTGAIRLNRPIVGMAAMPTGRGYWFVASDGGIFSYGDARFFGSTGAIRLNRPIVGMAATPTGRGYWFVASDGGVFSFGDATFAGSIAAGSVVTMVGSPLIGKTSSRVEGASGRESTNSHLHADPSGPPSQSRFVGTEPYVAGRSASASPARVAIRRPPRPAPREHHSSVPKKSAAIGLPSGSPRRKRRAARRLLRLRPAAMFIHRSTVS